MVYTAVYTTSRRPTMSATNFRPKPQAEASDPSEPAPKTAKLFKNGRSQAVRLPKEFRFEGKEVAIRRDEATGEVVIAPVPVEPPSISFDEWFALYDAIPDDAPAEEFAKLPPRPKNLTWEQIFKIFDRATYGEDFFERRTSMPRELDLF
jgi:antitoxin VapB